MDLSIVIVTYNSDRFIDVCLHSIRHAMDAGDGFGATSVDVCVVDNRSTDGTVGTVRAEHPWVRVIESERNGGFAHGVNLGLRHTSGDCVLWLNPDSRVLPGAGQGVRSVLAWLREHPKAGVLGGRILDPDGSVQRSVRTFPSYGSVLGARYSLLTRLWPDNPFSQEFLRTDLSYDQVATVDWVSGACLLHRRAVSDQLHGLDEGYFMYFEDVDFCYRATQAGWTVHFHPGFSVEHHIGGSSEQAPIRMLVARHRSMWRWYTKTFRRFWLKDAFVYAGIWARCGWLVLARLWR
jgi:N-acetylglucosaminyl-diphospho-decaprenol L-rhamnosyltransferase